jgi:hypothetical protein
MNESEKATRVLEYFENFARYKIICINLNYILKQKCFKIFWEIARYIKYESRLPIGLYEYESGLAKRSDNNWAYYLNSTGRKFGKTFLLERKSCETFRLDGYAHGYSNFTKKFYIKSNSRPITSLRHL